MNSPRPLATLALLALALPPSGCATVGNALKGAFKRPEVDFRTLHLRDLSFESVTLDFEFLVKNPNSVGVSLAALDYALDLDGKSLARGESAQAIRLKARGEAPVRLPLTVTFRDLADNLAMLFSDKNEVPYALAAGFALDTPVGPIRIPVSNRGQVPLPKVPEVQVANVRLANLSLAGARVEFEFDVRNKSTFPIAPRGFAYDLSLAGTSVSAGTQPLPPLAANATGKVTLPVQLDFLRLGTAAVQAVRSRTLPYSVKGQVDLGVFRQPFDVSGTARL